MGTNSPEEHFACVEKLVRDDAHSTLSMLDTSLDSADDLAEGL